MDVIKGVVGVNESERMGGYCGGEKMCGNGQLDEGRAYDGVKGEGKDGRRGVGGRGHVVRWWECKSGWQSVGR